MVGGAVAPPIFASVKVSVTVVSPAADPVHDVGETSVHARSGAVALSRKDWVAESPPGSLAVIVMLALPGACAVIEIVDPATLTVATPVSDMVAVYVKISPSGSEKYWEALIVAVVPTRTVVSGIVPRGCGARFGTMTAKLCWP